MRIAQVMVDVPTVHIDSHFDYLIPEGLTGVDVGVCVSVPFGSRPVVGYVAGLSDFTDTDTSRLKSVEAVLSEPYFGERSADVARWISREYLAPLSEALRLFLPPGGTPRAVRDTDSDGSVVWSLRRPDVGPVDDRWVCLTDAGREFTPAGNATLQRAVIDALGAGPLRVAELSADLGSVDGAVKSLERRGVVLIERRRRERAVSQTRSAAPRHTNLTDGQSDAIEVISTACRQGGGVILLDGVTGSGKTEVYLRAIEETLGAGRSACVLVPEISLTPQTVGRFRTRFGDEVAVLHSRLTPGERFDQWDMVRTGRARVVVGARSALFAPFKDLGLIVIDEEHEGSYKQGSSPRYHSRDVAVRIAASHGCPLVLGSASPSLESRHRCESGEWTRVVLPHRVTGRPLPPVTVVDLAAEFAAGHRSMFSRPLTKALQDVRDAGSKAVLFLNRRGFASFLLCRACGHVPSCDSCTTSLTYHEVGSRLACHHCGAVRAVPPTCPRCSSPYLRLFGTGTQRVESELEALLPDWPIVRMDADTTKSRGSHERLLATFESLPSGVLLGTQMIAKGLDYPEVTLVGVITADVTLNLPDFRAGERTYQLLEQVAGRAGRGADEGSVIIQTYWPDHPALLAVASHDPEIFYKADRDQRAELGYPPYGRLANVLIRGRSAAGAEATARRVADALTATVATDWRVLGPSPAPLSRLKGVWRWHVLVKAPEDADISGVLASAMERVRPDADVGIAVDVDPLDLL